MTAVPTAEPVDTRGQTSARHPVRVDLDGDFALADLLALPEASPAPRLTATQANLVRLWRLDAPAAAEAVAGRPLGELDLVPGVPTDADTSLLHRIETGEMFRPPVHERVALLTPEEGLAWLALATHWIDLSRATGDLRFLNTACKLTGAVWSRHHGDAGAWEGSGLTAQLAAVGRLLGEATDRLSSRLANRVVLAEPAKSEDEDKELHPVQFTGTVRARTVVLAAAGSRSAGHLVATAAAAGLPIEKVCWYTAGSSGGASSSNYSSAWYPPSPPDQSTALTMPSGVPVATAESWDDVAAAIRAADADLVLLVGMPVVPARVLGAAKLGLLNAHNGALPSHRGMDAVGWALLRNEPIVCTLHIARPAVDSGEVVAVHPVPVAPARTLATRVKIAQLRLLLAGAAHVAATGALPDLTPQPAAGTQFYRLHPHLKRVLDASPYASALRHDDPRERDCAMTNGISKLPHPSFTALAEIDWDDTTSILRGCTPLLDALATDTELLSRLVARVRDDPHLAEMCEGYDFMHKLVLHDAADLNVRLRLHVYQAGFFDRPHNHRWSFASHILRGGYVHRIFGCDDQFGEHTDPHDLLPIHERLERPGSTYALHHTSVHTVQAEADTVSLLVRGPSAKQRFLILDSAADRFFWVYGAAEESPEQRAMKRLTAEQLDQTIARIQCLIADLEPASRSSSLNGR